MSVWLRLRNSGEKRDSGVNTGLRANSSRGPKRWTRNLQFSNASSWPALMQETESFFKAPGYSFGQWETWHPTPESSTDLCGVSPTLPSISKRQNLTSMIGVSIIHWAFPLPTRHVLFLVFPLFPPSSSQPHLLLFCFVTCKKICL